MRYEWGRLNTQQVGAFAEYFVKMELTMYGFEVYTTEVDDRGVDFVCRRPGGPFLEVQVKSLRKLGYVFMRKEHFQPREGLFVAVVLLHKGQPPDLYLIESTVWANRSGESSGIDVTDSPFVDHDYVDKKSAPEWGINLSRKALPQLAEFAFDRVVERL